MSNIILGEVVWGDTTEALVTKKKIDKTGNQVSKASRAQGALTSCA